jgi:hypothetical protein
MEKPKIKKTQQQLLNEQYIIPTLSNYWMNGYGSLQYRDKNGKAQYCKKVDGKSGFVWIYKNGERKEFNVHQWAIKLIEGFSEVAVKRDVKNILTSIYDNNVDGSDKRRKDGVDKGVMSSFKSPVLETKPLSELLNKKKEEEKRLAELEAKLVFKPKNKKSKKRH